MFDLNGYTDWTLWPMVEESIHHEFFHIADKRGFRDNNEAWCFLNVEREASYLGDKWRLCAERTPGFIRPYSLKSIDEDQATVAESLFASPAALACLMEDDTVVRCKVRQIQSMYEQWSSGRMREQFWIDLEQDAVGPAYWHRLQFARTAEHSSTTVWTPLKGLCKNVCGRLDWEWPGGSN